ncbi:hypothetical protein [Encephalitozoon cuniculi GB-M1]|uniref:Uncharacterized protein n=2 Tax=Encephalitozoon cuniculi TaxID=6035 RepID=Q8SWG1_ENCCU|nr:uncharacterized protein ECU02_0220 [Encephalitozoon cuniculi GB-M1]AGE95626.1 hypothetical protein ECU02_0220 [Encephalitozoon cuniculi]KMV66541.1 hypothetical protein M970_020150 [Encephalitozoon cuniculi EcunIII-L]UYI28209.1 hypothetical protein J0A71_10g21110 [Encephalitozoon cuniculi]CAD25053.1 hypothetical protein [Encephalitozoon cuniculi GB-M1]
MGNKPGLLPKWLFVYTILKAMYVLVAYKDHLAATSRGWELGSAYVYLTLLLGITRLLSSRKITIVGFYSSIAISFLAEGLFFVYGGFRGIYSIHRMLVEAFFVLFTLGWMIFLYPYYLLEDKELPKKPRDESVKHQ